MKCIEICVSQLMVCEMPKTRRRIQVDESTNVADAIKLLQTSLKEMSGDIILKKTGCAVTQHARTHLISGLIQITKKEGRNNFYLLNRNKFTVEFIKND